MARTGPWRVYAQHDCLHLIGPVYSRDYIVPAMNMTTCPKCGEPCDLNARDSWAKVVRRKVRTGRWFLPWTWRQFTWEYKQLGHLEDGGYNYRTSMRNARKT